MNIERIKQLEQEIASLRRDFQQMQSVGGTTSRRNPRLALTTDDYVLAPTYPEAPEEGDPIPKTFPFVFVDATFANSLGTDSATYNARQNYSGAVNPRTYFDYAYNVCGKYIPKLTLIDVFEDNGKFWTNWNDSTGETVTTTTPVEKNSIKLTGATPVPPDLDVWEKLAFSISDHTLLNTMGLTYNSGAKRFTATKAVKFLVNYYARYFINNQTFHHALAEYRFGISTPLVPIDGTLKVDCLINSPASTFGYSIDSRHEIFNLGTNDTFSVELKGTQWDSSNVRSKLPTSGGMFLEFHLLLTER